MKTQHSQKKKKKIERKEITSAGKDMEKTEHFCITGGNVSWYSHYGEQYGDSFKN